MDGKQMTASESISDYFAGVTTHNISISEPVLMDVKGIIEKPTWRL